MDLIFQRCNIRLSNYISDIGGKSYRKVVKSIIEKETDPSLLTFVHSKTRKRYGDSIPQSALEGGVDEVNRDLLCQSLEEAEFYERHLRESKEKMREIGQKYFPEQIELLCTISGAKELFAMSILAEIGVDMNVFLSAPSLVG